MKNDERTTIHDILDTYRKMCKLLRDVGGDDDQYLMVKLGDMEKILNVISGGNDDDI